MFICRVKSLPHYSNLLFKFFHYAFNEFFDSSPIARLFSLKIGVVRYKKRASYLGAGSRYIIIINLRSLFRTRERYIISYVTTVVNTVIHNTINKLIVES